MAQRRDVHFQSHFRCHAPSHFQSIFGQPHGYLCLRLCLITVFISSCIMPYILHLTMASIVPAPQPRRTPHPHFFSCMFKSLDSRHIPKSKISSLQIHSQPRSICCQAGRQTVSHIIPYYVHSMSSSIGRHARCTKTPCFFFFIGTPSLVTS